MRWIAFLNVTKAINKDTKTFLLNFQQGVILNLKNVFACGEFCSLLLYVTKYSSVDQG